MTQTTLEPQSLARELPARYEIDSDIDPDFGILYRVWQSFHLCGTFYQDADGYWVPQPVKCSFRPHVETEFHAQQIIVAVYENPYLQAE